MDKIEQLIGLLDRFKLTVYHFTDEINLESIRTHGILSMRELRARGIVPVSGGNQWSLDADLHSGMDAYAHLCFLRQHPMEWAARQDGRIEKSRFLRIDPRVLALPHVMIFRRAPPPPAPDSRRGAEIRPRRSARGVGAVGEVA